MGLEGQVTLVQNSDDLKNKLKEAGSKLVVIDFFAVWCGPCKMIGPMIEELAKDMQDIVFLKVDVDECEDVAAEYEISSMPTFVFIKESKVLETFSGANIEKLKNTIQQHNDDKTENDPVPDLHGRPNINLLEGDNMSSFLPVNDKKK